MAPAYRKGPHEQEKLYFSGPRQSLPTASNGVTLDNRAAGLVIDCQLCRHADLADYCVHALLPATM